MILVLVYGLYLSPWVGLIENLPLVSGRLVSPRLNPSFLNSILVSYTAAQSNPGFITVLLCLTYGLRIL